MKQTLQIEIDDSEDFGEQNALSWQTAIARAFPFCRTVDLAEQFERRANALVDG